MLTTRTDTADVVEGLEPAANDYLEKPFHPAELRARIAVGRRTLGLQASLAAGIRERHQALEDIKTLCGIFRISM